MYLISRGPVVQRLEPSAHNGVVVGSNPTGPTISFVNNCVFEFSVCVTSVVRLAVTEGLTVFAFAFNNNLM